MATWVHEISRHLGTKAVQRAESGHIPFVPSEAQNANTNCSVCQQEKQRLQMAMVKIPQGEDPTHSWQVDYTEQMSVAPVGYRWVLIE